MRSAIFVPGLSLVLSNMRISVPLHSPFPPVPANSPLSAGLNPILVAYCPRGQDLHLVSAVEVPALSRIFPSGHGLCAWHFTPFPENVPAGHALHVRSLALSPAKSISCPAGHPLYALQLPPDKYLPVGHCSHFRCCHAVLTSFVE